MRVRSFLGLIGVAVIIASCNNGKSLKGKWHYAGGIYDGKKEGGTQGYQLERNYTDNNFEAFMIEGTTTPQKYQAGNYELKGDSCVETETFSTQPSKLTSVGVHYNYQLRKDTLVLKGTLPTGMKVEEYWTKAK